MKVIHILFSVLLFSQCAANKVENKKEVINEPEPVMSCGMLDTAFNNIMYFLDSESTLIAFPNIDSAWRLNDRAYFVNRDSTTYVSLGVNYGGGKYEYKEAEIGYVVGSLDSFIPQEIKSSSLYEDLGKSMPSFYFLQSGFREFVTDCGVMLGINSEEFMFICRLKRWDIEEKVVGNQTVYTYYNDYCMYEGEYTFEKDRLVKFSFGYVTP